MNVRKLLPAVVFTAGLLSGFAGAAQSPELLLREFASGQIKKGVRSIGMGGDGATWGNYSLVWRDSSTALVDAGVTTYTNNNVFSFTAVGFTTPALWHGLTIYAIALSQTTSDITILPPAFPMHGNGSNQALFVKAAMPLGKGFSVGVLMSYEHSQFNGLADAYYYTDAIKYETHWLPSGGVGVSWQPVDRVLVGVRGLFNIDRELRTLGGQPTEYGLNSAQEYRAGISVGLWKGALADAGGNFRHRYNEISRSKRDDLQPNLGFEQTLFKKHLSLRCGLDETSWTGGFTLRSKILVFDAAYVKDMAQARLKGYFGPASNSVITTLTFNYGRYKRG